MSASALPALVQDEEQRLGKALLAVSRSAGTIESTSFDRLVDHLVEGDLLVVNNSATLPASLPVSLAGEPLELRVSTPVEEGGWLVELRTEDLRPHRPPPPGARVELPARASATVLGPYRDSRRLAHVRLDLPEPLPEYLARHGRPIRYPHDHDAPLRPIDDYQTAFAVHPGSAEAPSAALPFTPRLVAELAASGVLIAPITLHTGVSSLEAGEAPYPERYRVPWTTARLVNAVHEWRGRVIAVGTTVVRALETTARDDGSVRPGAGFTDLVVTPERGLRAIDGLLTGWHEPESSHLRLLEAAAGADLLERSYAAAKAHGYRWHEFGDSHLILP
jgi:S-adenosylmethionine:tRNA ribosyltransferase-isomerase